MDDRVNLGVVPSLANLTNNFTVAGWVRPDRLSGVQRVLSGGSWGFGLVGTQIRFTTYTVRDYNTTLAAIPLGEWSHIAAVMKPDFSVDFYVNGTFVQTITHNLAGQVRAGGFTIGTAGVNEFFDGTLKDVGVWNGLLTQSQLDLVRAGDIAGTNPVGFWRLNEGTGTTVRSSGVSALNGTLENGLSWPIQVTGNLLSNDSDIDAGTILSIDSVGGGTATTVSGLYGALVWNANGTYKYTLNNSLPAVQQLASGQTLTESFAYTLSDGVASVASSLTITITGVNDAPVAAANSNAIMADSVIRIVSGGYDDVVLADSPVAYWRLSETEGSIAANRMAPGTPDGIINGAIGYGQLGLLANGPDTALLFDGTQTISIADSLLINTYSGNATAKTIELWFNAPTYNRDKSFTSKATRPVV